MTSQRTTAQRKPRVTGGFYASSWYNDTLRVCTVNPQTVTSLVTFPGAVRVRSRRHAAGWIEWQRALQFRWIPACLPTPNVRCTYRTGVLRLSIAACCWLPLRWIRSSGQFLADHLRWHLRPDRWVMTWLSLLVARLIALSTSTDALQSRLNQRFTMGFWHLEPIVLGVSGTLMIGVRWSTRWMR